MRGCADRSRPPLFPTQTRRLTPILTAPDPWVPRYVFALIWAPKRWMTRLMVIAGQPLLYVSPCLLGQLYCAGEIIGVSRMIIHLSACPDPPTVS